MLSSPFLFIVGRGRSGTTLLRAMFDSHPDMAIPPESHFIVPLGRQRRRYERHGGIDVERLIRDLEGTGFRDWDMNAAQVTSALASAETYPDAVRGLFAAYAASHGKTRYGEKTPVNVRNVRYLARLIPEAIFVHIIRDGRDVTISYLDVPFGPASVAESAIYWKLAVERGRNAGICLAPTRYREIKYEELLAQPKQVLEGLCEFSKLPFDPVMLRYHERIDQVTKGLRHPIARRSLGLPPTKGLRNWRAEMRPEDLALFEALAGRTLTKFGYERSCTSTGFGERVDAEVARFGVHFQRAIGRGARFRRRSCFGRRGSGEMPTPT